MTGVPVRGDREPCGDEGGHQVIQVCLERGLEIWKPEPRKAPPWALWRGGAWMAASLDAWLCQVGRETVWSEYASPWWPVTEA